MLLRRTEGISEWGRIVEQAVAACRGRLMLFLLFLKERVDFFPFFADDLFSQGYVDFLLYLSGKFVFFLAVQDSSIGDLVTHSLSE